MGQTLSILPADITDTETEMRVLATAKALVLVASVAPAPQFGGLKSLVKSLTGDDKPGEVNGDYEQVPYEMLTKYNGYEERRYPSVNYACTRMTYDAADDEESQEIEMTVPVWSKMIVSQDGKITKEMCFYITKEFQSNPPEPVDPEVKIVKSKERVVFVKQFG